VLSDRCPALRHAEEHQFCLAQSDSAMRSTAIAHGDTIFAAPTSSALLTDACAVGRRRPISPTPPLPRIAAVSKRQLERLLARNRPMPRSAICGDAGIPRLHDTLCCFLKRRYTDATNNESERALRRRDLPQSDERVPLRMGR